VAGAVWDQSCDGTNSEVAGVTTSAGPYTFVGEETLRVDGVDVRVHHYRQDRRLSGSQTGEQHREIWIALTTGLPLRAERSTSVQSSSPVGDITYTEQGWWQVQSATPTT
jgi:hypothetical protein